MGSHCWCLKYTHTPSVTYSRVTLLMLKIKHTHHQSGLWGSQCWCVQSHTHTDTHYMWPMPVSVSMLMSLPMSTITHTHTHTHPHIPSVSYPCWGHTNNVWNTPPPSVSNTCRGHMAKSEIHTYATNNQITILTAIIFASRLMTFTAQLQTPGQEECGYTYQLDSSCQCTSLCWQPL